MSLPLESAGTNVTSWYVHATSRYDDGISRYSVPASAGSLLPLTCGMVQQNACNREAVSAWPELIIACDVSNVAYYIQTDRHHNQVTHCIFHLYQC